MTESKIDLFPHVCDYATQEEFNEALRLRREFVIKNNPTNIIKRQVEIDEAVCPEGICDGSGRVPKQIFDTDAKEWITDGEEDCLHVKIRRDDSEE